MLLQIFEMKPSVPIVPLGASTALFFLVSLIRELCPSVVGMKVLWRSLAWAVGLLFFSGLAFTENRCSLATDILAFLSPVWGIRIWLGSGPDTKSCIENSRPVPSLE